MKKIKIYLGSPISKYVRKGMNKDYVDTMNCVYEILKTYGETYFPLKKEAYGEDKTAGSGEVCTKVDFDKVNESDYIVAFPEDSQGVSVELGWASSAKKKVLVFIDKNYHQSELIRYIDYVTPATKITIDTKEGYTKELPTIKKAIEDYFGGNK